MAAAASGSGAFPASSSPNAEQLRAAFGAAVGGGVGIEDELMLLHPDTLELVPCAKEVLERLGEDPRFKLELPASQLEIVIGPSTDLEALAVALLEARRVLAARAEGLVRPAAAGVHPFSPGVGELNAFGRYGETIEEYGAVAARQLVCALQVHVGIGDADRALAVYNAARSYLPLLAALAANAPFYEGRDTGLASVRPKLSELLPRQGIPPRIESWQQYAAVLAWGARSDAFPTPRTWWWELRPHTQYGTLEFRVPDGQSTAADAIAIAAVIQALAAWLGERHDAGEREHVAESWRIAENRWSACRYGVQGTMADLQTGERHTTRELLGTLLEQLTPVASRLCSSRWIDHARTLLGANGAILQRRAAANGGAAAAAVWLADRFLSDRVGVEGTA